MSWHDRQHAAGRDARVLQQLERDEPVVGRRLGVVEDRRAAARGGRGAGSARCRASPRLVSRVSAAGSTWRKRRPPASNVDTPSVVSEPVRRVVGARAGACSWYGELGATGRTVRRQESRRMPWRLSHRARLDGRGAGADDARWGAQTQRAVENFPISGGRSTARSIARARARSRARPRAVNGGSRRPSRRRTSPTRSTTPPPRWRAAWHDDQFPIDVFQTGSGTSSNMNMNEVLAGLASERLGGRCTRTTTSTRRSRRTTCSRRRSTSPRRRRSSTTSFPRSSSSRRRCGASSGEFADVVKSGRTHLMDATPVTLGQEFGGYAAQVDDGIARLARRAAPRRRAAARRHRGRHRHQRAEGVRRAR